MGWLPSYASGGSISVSIGSYYEWNGTINTVLGTRTISDEASFISFNDELIAALQNGTISYQDYTDNVYKAYTQSYKNIPYDISKDPNYINDPIFRGQNNSFLYGENGAQINLDNNSEILISNGQFSAIMVVGSKAVNNGEITGLEHYFNNIVNVMDGSAFINNGIINKHVTTDNKYSDLPVYTTSQGQTNTIYVNNNSNIINTGIINSASISNTNDSNTSLIAIKVQNNSSITNSGIINFGVQNISEVISTQMNAGLQLNNKSSFYNTADGKFSVGKSAQSDKNQTQTYVNIDSSKGKTVGINSNDSIILNEGLFELSETTKNISLIDVIASQVQNDGVIQVEGVNNIGINVSGSDAIGKDTLVINNGNLLIQKGSDIKGIKASNFNGKGFIQIQNTNSGVITIDGNNSFTSGSDLVRNYGMWVEGENAIGINDGKISLVDGGSVGVHARNNGVVYVNSNSSMAFSGEGSQIGYFSYGEGSVIQFNNPTKSSNVDSQNSNFARVENGANLIFVNNPNESTEINLNADSTLGFHISGNSTGFLADSNIKLNLIGNNSTGFLASNGGQIEISDSMKTVISGDNAIFAIADGQNYKIDNTIVEGDGYLSKIISSAVINDSVATGSGVIGYLSNKDGVIYHQGVIDLQNKGDATGIKIDGGTVVNSGSVSVNGTGVHVIGDGSVYQGSDASLVKATDGNAAFFIDKDAKLNLVGGTIEASKNAHGILVDSQALELSIANATLSSDGDGDVIHNNADITITMKDSLLTASGNNTVIDHNANNATYNLDGVLIQAKSNEQNAVSFNTGNGSLDATNATHIIGAIKTNSGATSDVTLTNNSVWNILYSGSNVTNLTNTTGSIIDLTDQSDPTDPSDPNYPAYPEQLKYNTLNVDNNYIGGTNQPTENDPIPAGNGKLYVNTLWNVGESKSDLLAIAGEASGYTEVAIKNGKIIGDIQKGDSVQYSANVVTVANHTEGSNSFYGFADTTGAGQAILVQKDANSYAWSLPTNGVDPVKPEVPSYVLTPKANMELGYNILGTLHQRVSEQQTMAWDDCSQCQVEHQAGQLWGRFLGNYLKASGSDRYGYRSKMWGVQFGYDFDIDYDENSGSRSHTGVMLSYAKDNLKFRDSRYVSFDTNSGVYTENDSKTGTGSIDMFAIGLYSTHYDKNGSYLDLIGQLDYSRLKYDSIASDKSKNHSKGVSLSAEVGRPFALAESQWLIEPQAQLIYQYRDFNDFNTRHDIAVSQDDRHGLRGRLGFRLAYNEGTEELKTKTVYFVGNVIHDFINSDKNATIDSDNVSEKMARTWGEFGVGLQLPIGEISYIYTDLRYAHSLNNDDGKHEQYTGNLGIKWHF
ncbi:autotransporter outer membrane beta-barrel domain-containing protein [Orbus mooreae]|uniref:autotransporter outer membrane beta-barrel domain-containing protein n=1 Tax=Orbus mooreae TaxID=3074107 RepID=UPI00370D03EF